MIFQEFNLVNRMSVMDNVLSGRLGYTGSLRSLLRLFPRADIDRALDILDRVGLVRPCRQARRRTLRRAAPAGRHRPRPDAGAELLLLDEPTSALDPKISRDVMGLMQGLAREYRVPALCNIHDVQLALEFCNRVIGLQDGFKKFDGPAEMSHPQADLDEIYAMEVL